MIDFTESMQMQEANSYNYQKSAFLITFSTYRWFLILCSLLRFQLYFKLKGIYFF